MSQKITSVNLSVAIVLGLLIVAGLLAGISLPLPNSSSSQAPVSLEAQAVVNSFRNVVIKPADDTIPLSITLYTTPTVSALSINNSSGSTLVEVAAGGSLYVNGYLRSSDGTVYVYDGFKVRQDSVFNGAVTVTGTLTYGGLAFTYTEPITIADVLTNVRLLYYQIP